MQYTGHAIAVEQNTYLHTNGSKPDCRYVKTQQSGVAVSLPLVFPKPNDLSRCIELNKPTLTGYEAQRPAAVNIVTGDCKQRMKSLLSQKEESKGTQYQIISKNYVNQHDTVKAAEMVRAKYDKVKAAEVIRAKCDKGKTVKTIRAWDVSPKKVTKRPIIVTIVSGKPDAITPISPDPLVHFTPLAGPVTSLAGPVAPLAGHVTSRSLVLKPLTDEKPDNTPLRASNVFASQAGVTIRIVKTKSVVPMEELPVVSSSQRVSNSTSPQSLTLQTGPSDLSDHCYGSNIEMSSLSNSVVKLPSPGVPSTVTGVTSTVSGVPSTASDVPSTVSDIPSTISDNCQSPPAMEISTPKIIEFPPLEKDFPFNPAATVSQSSDRSDARTEKNALTGKINLVADSVAITDTHKVRIVVLSKNDFDFTPTLEPACSLAADKSASPCSLPVHLLTDGPENDQLVSMDLMKITTEMDAVAASENTTRKRVGEADSLADDLESDSESSSSEFVAHSPASSASDFMAESTPVSKTTLDDFFVVKNRKTVSAKSRQIRSRACRECIGCMASDCQQCTYCNDMRRYGGSGKLKQKCRDRRCRNMGRKPFDRVEPTVECVKPETATTSTPVINIVPKALPVAKENVNASLEMMVSAKVPKVILDDAGVTYNLKIREEMSEVRKIPNCGKCTNCLDKKQFGGLNRKKQMCLEKKKELKRRLARISTVDVDEENLDDEQNKHTYGRTSSRKRKLSRKMEESLDQEWTDVVKAKMLSMTDYASSFLDNYLESIHEVSEDNSDSDSDASTDSSESDRRVSPELSYDLLDGFMDGVDDMLAKMKHTTDKPADSGDSTDEKPTTSVAVNTTGIQLIPMGDGHEGVDLTKKTIDQSMAEHVISLRPDIVTLNKAITTPHALRFLLSGLLNCSELSMKGVTAVAKLGLADVPFTVTHLNISNVSDLKDTTFSTLFFKEAIAEASLGIEQLDLSYTSISDNSLKLIASYLPMLATLHLNACSQITNTGITHLTNSKRLFSLREIEMNDCEGIDIDSLKLLTSAKGLNRVKSLNFNGCPNISVNEVKTFVTSTQELEPGEVGWTHSRRHLQKLS